jgi:chromosome segregation ATPase
MPRGLSKNKHPELYSVTPTQAPQNSRTLATKERELAEWEAQLTKRQDLYDNAASNAELRLKTVEAKIEAGQEELARLSDELTAKTVAHEAAIRTMDMRTSDWEVRAAEARDKYDKAKGLVDELDAHRRKTEENLAELNNEIETRKQYLKDQEEVIDKTIASGNQELNNVNREVAGLEKEREALLGNLHAEGLKVSHLKEEVSDRESDLNRLNLRYDEAAHDYRAKLTEVKLAIAEAEDARDRVLAETSQKLLDLKAERAEIETLRTVVTKQREEVWAEKRRLESMRTQYGL